MISLPVLSPFFSRSGQFSFLPSRLAQPRPALVLVTEERWSRTFFVDEIFLLPRSGTLGFWRQIASLSLIDFFSSGSSTPRVSSSCPRQTCLLEESSRSLPLSSLTAISRRLRVS